MNLMTDIRIYSPNLGERINKLDENSLENVINNIDEHIDMLELEDMERAEFYRLVNKNYNKISNLESDNYKCLQYSVNIAGVDYCLLKK